MSIHPWRLRSAGQCHLPTEKNRVTYQRLVVGGEQCHFTMVPYMVPATYMEQEPTVLSTLSVYGQNTCIHVHF